MRTNVQERFGRIEDLDRSFDLSFWQKQGEKARFAATWELIEMAWRIKGNDLAKLRLQRTVESFQRISG
ncbi:MAG: hypothetical protein OHK0029_31330 [Armatimonadaceae bacterium]